MASYLLLRSNKKSGPYSLQDLVNFGLKAYDLVWVEGKSASWRYPSELAELKPYAPVIEEQPYDRFFKKPSEQVEEQPIQLQKARQARQTALSQELEQFSKQQKVQQQNIYAPSQSIPATGHNTQPPAEKIVVEEKPILEKKPEVKQEPLVQQPAFEEQYEKYLPKKSVFVTLPGNKTVVVQKPAEVNQAAVPVAPPTPPAPVATMPATTITVKENPEAQIKYSQPLDEIKEMYVKTLQERKDKIARKTIWLSYMKKAAVIAGLVASGVVAGLIINRGSGKGSTLSQTKPVQSTGIALTHDVAQPTEQSIQPVENNSQPAETSSSVLDNTPIQNDLKTEIVNPPSSLPRREKEQLRLQEREQQFLDPSDNIRRDPISRNQAKQVYEEKPLQTDPKTGERNRNMRSENDITVEENRPAAKAVLKQRKSGLENQVSVTSNDYKRVAFGGIRNLELTVTNDSKFILDKVTVELQYLKPSEEPLRTEMVQFNSISPNGAMTMRIRDTNRGIKVLYKIIDIQAAGQETALNGF